MADQQIEDLGELTAPAVGDTLIINDVSDTTDDVGGSVKKIAYQNVGKLPVSDETSSFTATRNTHHRVTVGTAARTVTMPSSGLLDGDRVRITVAAQGTATGSFAQAPGHAVGFSNPTSINGASYTGATTGKWSLWITGETLLLEYDATNTTWWVVEDRRAVHLCKAWRNAAQTTVSGSFVEDQIELDAVTDDVGKLFSSSNHRIQIKRAGQYAISIGGAIPQQGDGERGQMQIYKNGTGGTLVLFNRGYSSAALGVVGFGGSNILSLASGDYLELHCQATTSFTSLASNDGSKPQMTAWEIK